nr:hypothetical protein [Vibrio splendidus]MCC4882759.1 hypothetical protein [Vibrio splendidus]
MGKYTSANKLVRRLIQKETGLIVLAHNDPRIDTITEQVAVNRVKRGGITGRELARQYRFYCNRLMVALKDHHSSKLSLLDTALKHNVCIKLLTSANNQSA